MEFFVCVTIHEDPSDLRRIFSVVLVRNSFSAKVINLERDIFSRLKVTVAKIG